MVAIQSAGRRKAAHGLKSLPFVVVSRRLDPWAGGESGARASGGAVWSGQENKGTSVAGGRRARAGANETGTGGAGAWPIGTESRC